MLVSPTKQGCFVITQLAASHFRDSASTVSKSRNLHLASRLDSLAADGLQRVHSLGGLELAMGAGGQPFGANANACLMLLKFEVRNRCTSFFEHFLRPTRCLIRFLNLTLRTTGCSGSTSHGCKYNIAGDPDCLISFIALIVRLSGNKRK